MSRLTIGLVAATVVCTVSSVAIGVLLLFEAKRLGPKVRSRVTDVPDWLREHVPDAPPLRMVSDLDAIRDEMARVRELLERQGERQQERV